MKLILATHNKNKLKEIRDLINGTNFNIVSLFDLNDNEEIVENGSSFIENANIKALTIAKKYDLLTIADDSGLEVYELNNEPGIYSARYSKDGSHGNNLKLLKNLEGSTNRKARFVCVISIANKDGVIANFTGTLEGKIATSLDGTEGFGYDPIFIPEGYESSLAKLGNDLKSMISHRSVALRSLIEFLNSNYIK